MAFTVHALPGGVEDEVDEAQTARVLQILYEAGAFPDDVNEALERAETDAELQHAGELMVNWLQHQNTGEERPYANG